MTSERELREYDDWAERAVGVVENLSEAQRRNLLRHVFRVVAYHRANAEVQPDAAVLVAVELCCDLASTIELRLDSRLDGYPDGAVLDEPVVVDRAKLVSIDETLERLRQL